MICNDKTAGRSWKRLTGLSLSLSPYPTISTAPQTHTFYPHASLPSRAISSHTPSRDPDFTQPIHCVSGNNPPLSLLMKGWRGEERAEGKKGRMPPCLVRQCCLFFSCCVRPANNLSFPFTTTKSSSWLFRYTRTTRSFMFCHTHSVWQSGEARFFSSSLPVNGLRNLCVHWSCRAKEKVTAEAKKKSKQGRVPFMARRNSFSLSHPLNRTNGCSYISNCSVS